MIFFGSSVPLVGFEANIALSTLNAFVYVFGSLTKLDSGYSL